MKVQINPDIIKGLQGDTNSPFRELHDLIDNPPSLEGSATRHNDGRRIPVVIGMVHDPQGRTRAGVRIVLEDKDGTEVHTVRTTPHGTFALRFPEAPESRHGTTGRVRVLLPGAGAPKVVHIPPGSQHITVYLRVEDLPLPSRERSRSTYRTALIGNGLTGELEDETEEEAEDAEEDITGEEEGTDADVLEDDDTSSDSSTGDETTQEDVELPGTDGAVVLDDQGDDPFDVLPVDMTPELCDAATSLFAPNVDTILSNPDRANDFRSRRTRLIKTLTVPRIAPASVADEAPRRYLVTIRQDWKFLGYTLGEVADIDPLAPGAILQRIQSEIETSTRRTSSSVRNVERQVTTILESALNRLSSVDTLVEVTNNIDTEKSTTVETSNRAGVGPQSRTGSIVGGIVGGIAAGPVGALVGAAIGSGGVEAELGNDVETTLATSLESRTMKNTKIDSSLEVNSRTREAQSIVNRSVSEISSATRSLRRTTRETLDQVSPLVSRVTNLIEWQLYENYMVCSHVEDVVEVRDYPVFGKSDKSEDLFTADDIVEYRRFFEPNLLEPRLAPRFSTLAAGLHRERMGEAPVTAIRVTARFLTNGISGGTLEVQVGEGDDERSMTLTLDPGSTRATGTLVLPEPLDVDSLGQMDLKVTVHPATVRSRVSNGFFPQITTEPDPNARVQVTRLHIGFLPGAQRGAFGGTGRLQRVDPGNSLTAAAGDPTAEKPVDLDTPPVDFNPELDPLYIHINRNETHYFSLLLQAAKDKPALRDDVRHLAGAQISGEGLLDSDSALWRLPIAGFEANRVLVIKDLDDDDEFGHGLRDDPGSATLIQLAAPGSYGESLQGLLELTDAAGKLHPELLPDPAPKMPPLALVDLQGKTLEVVQNGTTGNGLEDVEGDLEEVGDTSESGDLVEDDAELPEI